MVLTICVITIIFGIGVIVGYTAQETMNEEFVQCIQDKNFNKDQWNVCEIELERCGCND
jgi:hypothetical protein